MSNVIAVIEDAIKAGVSIGGGTITVGEVKNGLSVLQNFPVADVQAALSLKLASLPDDLIVAGDIADGLAQIGVPYAGDVALAIKVLAWVAANGTQTQPGSLTPIPSGKRGSDPWIP